MNILCTTSRSVLLLDTETGVFEVLDTGRGLYYGIAYSDREIFVLARGRPVSTEEERRTENAAILVFGFDKRFRREINAPFLLRDAHQIYYHEDRLWIACSFDNMIAIFDGNNWEKWYPNPEKKGWDANHFNSVVVRHDRLYVAAHNHDRPSQILEFLYPELDRIDVVEMGSQIHNIWIMDGKRYTCSSKDNAVINESGFVLPVGGYARGIAVTDEFIFVGVSEMAERHRRQFTTGLILIFDRAWRYLRRIQLTGQGLVLEIRTPGFTDICYPGHLGKMPALRRRNLLVRWSGNLLRTRFPVSTTDFLEATAESGAGKVDGKGGFVKD